MPMSSTQHPSLEAFIAGCRDAGITRLALCWRKEWGPQQVADDPTAYGPKEEIRLLGYCDGTIHSCDLDGRARDDLAAELVDAGFEVELRTRNIATYDRND